MSRLNSILNHNNSIKQKQVWLKGWIVIYHYFQKWTISCIFLDFINTQTNFLSLVSPDQSLMDFCQLLLSSKVWICKKAWEINTKVYNKYCIWIYIDLKSSGYAVLLKNKIVGSHDERWKSAHESKIDCKNSIYTV